MSPHLPRKRALYCNRTVTVSAAPRGIHDGQADETRPIGMEEQRCGGRSGGCSGTPLTMTVSGARPPVILSATGSVHLRRDELEPGAVRRKHDARRLAASADARRRR